MQIHEELSGTILEWVKNGRPTLGIAFDDGNLERLDTMLILEERLFLIVHAKSPLAKRRLVSLREVAHLELVLSTPDQGVRTRIERAMARSGFSISRVVAEVNSLTFMKQAATRMQTRQRLPVAPARMLARHHWRHVHPHGTMNLTCSVAPLHR